MRGDRARRDRPWPRPAPAARAALSTPRASARPAHTHARAAALAACWAIPAGVLGCSSLAEDTPRPQCATDADCDSDEVCANDQGNVCVRGRVPPIAAMAFTVSEPATGFDGELRGCDPEIDRDGTVLAARTRGEWARALLIHLVEARAVQDCICPPPSTCDLETMQCVSPLPATVYLRQGSRLARDQQFIEQRPYPPLDPVGEPIEGAPLTVEWARYADESGTPALIMEIDPTTPEGSTAARSSVYRWIPDVAAVELADVVTRRECHRRVHGRVRALSGAPIEGALVTLQYGEPAARVDATVPQNAAPPCEDDDECPRGTRCEPLAGRCALDLTGAPAGDATSDVGGEFRAPVYSYCDVQGVPSLALRASIQFIGGEGNTPPPLPAMNFAFQQTFAPPLIAGSLPDDDPLSQGDLCVPDWSGEAEITMDVQGPPRTLLVDDMGRAWTCCALDCLPLDVPLESATPPTPPATCGGFARVRIERYFDEVDVDAWSEAGCVVPTVDADGHFGRYVRVIDAKDCTEGACTVRLATGGASASCAVSVQQTAGSVMRSVSVTRATPSEGDAWTLPGDPRVILRGQVACDPEADGCTAGGATIRAERLRASGETTALPPFLHDGTALIDGRFALPLDPGLYVITALPAVGALGGPAPFRVVDLRLDGSDVVFEGSTPVLTLSSPLELSEGRPVRLELPAFHASTSVTPLDFGSWYDQDEFERDLNDPATCWSESPTTACRIRALRAAKLLASGVTQFTARDRGSTTCP